VAGEEPTDLARYFPVAAQPRYAMTSVNSVEL
jgi:hypothetical protein